MIIKTVNTVKGQTTTTYYHAPEGTSISVSQSFVNGSYSSSRSFVCGGRIVQPVVLENEAAALAIEPNQNKWSCSIQADQISVGDCSSVSINNISIGDDWDDEDQDWGQYHGTNVNIVTGSGNVVIGGSTRGTVITGNNVIIGSSNQIINIRM
ncbi:MAG: hypothetical protein ACRCXZ_07120 [Patescibacteria group bacterium]